MSESSQQQLDDVQQVQDAIEVKSTDTSSLEVHNGITSTIVAMSPTMNQLHQAPLEIKSMATQSSIREQSSDFSLGERPSESNTVVSVRASSIEDSFILIDSSEEKDVAHQDVIGTTRSTKELLFDDMVVHEITSVYQEVSKLTQILYKYPNIIIKLCDGEIINADSGESILSLSQFMVDNELNEKSTVASNPSFPPSPQLIVDSEYSTPTQGQNLNQHLLIGSEYLVIIPEIPSSQQINQFGIDNRPPSQTLTQLNQSLIDHDETLVATSAPSSQTFEPVPASLDIAPSIQRSMLYDEAVTPLEVNNLELQVTEDMRDLLSNFPEGWWEGDTKMFYHTNEARWGAEGVPNEEVENIVKHRTNKVPTNADCITHLNDYIELDDPKIEHHIYYRRCKRPTNIEEVYRRHTFRIRRRRYFARPAINIGGLWFPEPYMPDPEDPEWSWKEGIEMDRPSQSVYQLTEGRVFWDPYKHLRVNGMHPYYRWPCHEQVINREIPPNPIRHVQGPLEQFARFDTKHYPSSKFNSKGKVDYAIYHPRYNGFKPKSLSDFDEPLDMGWIFYSPEGEEWCKQIQSGDVETNAKSVNTKSKSKEASAKEDPFYTSQMRSYLSPPRTSRQIQPARQENQKWGSYMGKTASSYKEDYKQHKDEGASGDTRKQNTTSVSNLIPHLRDDVTPMITTPIVTTEVLPSTSKGNPSKYVIPKIARQSIQSNKLNDLVAKVSPTARPILPRPPTLPRKSPPRNTSGTRSTRRRR